MVFSNPSIGTIDVRLMNSKDDSRDPYFQNSYDLKALSLGAFEREIEELINQADRPQTK